MVSGIDQMAASYDFNNRNLFCSCFCLFILQYQKHCLAQFVKFNQYAFLVYNDQRTCFWKIAQDDNVAFMFDWIQHLHFALSISLTFPTMHCKLTAVSQLVLALVHSAKRLRSSSTTVNMLSFYLVTPSLIHLKHSLRCSWRFDHTQPIQVCTPYKQLIGNHIVKDSRHSLNIV